MQARTCRIGWSEAETEELMERARSAREEGRPLREVFEATARTTGRRPNSIRNFYYSQHRSGERRRRFRPFESGEAENLTEQILSARAAGESVRACVMRMSGGDQRLMLRYQNKYRAMLRNRPDVVGRIMEKLRTQGITPPSPYRSPRRRAADTDAAPDEARIGGMMSALEAILDERTHIKAECEALCNASEGLLGCIRSYINGAGDERENGWGIFICELVKQAGLLEKALNPLRER